MLPAQLVWKYLDSIDHRENMAYLSVSGESCKAGSSYFYVSYGTTWCKVEGVVCFKHIIFISWSVLHPTNILVLQHC